MTTTNTLAEGYHRPNAVYLSRAGNLVTNGGLITADDGLWGNCPVLTAFLDPTFGFLYDERFQSYYAGATTGDWVATTVTAGSAIISTTVPGALLMDSGDSTIHHGIQIQRVKVCFIPAANKSLWFEATVNVGTALTGEYFVGLADVDTTVIGTGTLHAINCIGWSSTTGDGVMLFGATKASTSSTPATGVTLVVGTAVALGFFYDGVKDTVQQYINGVAVGAAIATADIPKVAIYPSLVCQSSGTTETTLTVSAMRAFQLR
jgi:hypothetical protein